MRAGAVDFVIKPVAPERLEVSIKNALKIESLAVEINRMKRQSSGTLTFNDLILRGEAMQRVIAYGRKAAGSNIPVLVEGESGVGKELIARAIQGESERKGKAFVTVNCGAIPENLVESTLFGHEKGSFTGAVDKRIGKFQEADGGTLFLDEVGELPLDAQVKLLRALQEGEIDPVGSKRPVKVDIRIIAATNRDMIQLVREGKFREDLYYRLSVFPLWVPPLRERMDDVPELARHFITKFAAEEGKRIDGFDAQASALLAGYSWPGNVRQLENAVFRAVVLAEGQTLTVCRVPADRGPRRRLQGRDPGGAPPGRPDAEAQRPGRARCGRHRAPHHRSRTAERHPGDRHPGRHRGWRDALARSHGSRHDPPGARPLSRPHDGSRQTPQHRPVDTLPEDERLRPRGAGQLSQAGGLLSPCAWHFSPQMTS